MPIRLVAACLFAVALVAGEPGWPGRYTLSLDGALATPPKAGAAVEPKPLELHLDLDGSAWTDAWGSAQTFDRSIHDGRVTSSALSDGVLVVEVVLDIEGDNWVKGGPARYRLELRRDGDLVVGSHSGSFQGAGEAFTAAGKVTGTVVALPPLRPGHVPVQPGEHPRLLFRASQLPELRARLATPVGQALAQRLRARVDDPVALGLLFQLTGDADLAARAFPATVAVLKNRNGGPFALGRFWGYRTSVVGMAYDLCHQAWSVEQREVVENYLDEILDLCLNRKHRVGTVNWDPGSNYTVVIHGGNGIAALALMGERRSAPSAPPAQRTAVLRLDAPVWTPAAGVPVGPLPLGATPDRWLFLGPFDLGALRSEDCLAAVGGMAAARPEPGQEVRFRSQARRWEALSRESRPDAFRRLGSGPSPETVVIDTPKLAGKEHVRLFFFAGVEVATAGWYRFQGNTWRGECFLAGERLGDGESVYLAAGRYPWLVPVRIGGPTGQAFPLFVPASEAEATAFIADPARQAAQTQALADHARDLAQWTASGGLNPTWEKNARTLARWNHLCAQMGMGDGGFQGEGEGYTLECHHLPHDYACAYRNVIGRELTGRPDLSHFAARYVATTVWPGEGRKAVSQSFGGHGGGTISARYFPRALALAADDWRPALFHHWLRLAGVGHDDAQTAAGALAASKDADDLSLAWAFVNWPTDLVPAAPAGRIPLVWQAPTRGFLAFRDGFRGADDVVAQIYAKAGANCGWNQAEAGCFQVFGLGRHWACKDNNANGKTGSRWLDNVVVLPDDVINANGRGRVVHVAGDPASGSGSVTIDLAEVYRGTTVDTGVSGLRAFAADHSGAAGVPGLYALADRVTGGKRKLWVHQIPPGRDARVEIDGHRFRIVQGDASWSATVIAPRDARIVRAKAPWKAQPESGINDVASGEAIHVSSADGLAGDFLVVFTLQRGAAPVVAVSGDGLAASASVGNATIRFANDRLEITRK